MLQSIQRNAFRRKVVKLAPIEVEPIEPIKVCFI